MNNIQEIISQQNTFFNQGCTKSIEFRLQSLKKLKQGIQKNEAGIMDALKKDLNKATFEAYATEVGFVLDEISYTIKHLKAWAKPRSVKTPITQFKSSSKIYKDPYGVVLVMSPWNYPFQLTLTPVVGAIAAGNCVIIKPSDYSSNTSKIIQQIIAESFDEAYIAVVLGGREANQSLISQKFDYICFTGSVSVGKTVMEAASKNLTPVTLELGGKSPCIVDETANIALAAKRIVWGKFINAGQTCVTPDYLLVHSSVKEALLENMKNVILKFYGATPCENTDYPKIINEKHYQRLLNLLTDVKIYAGGEFNNNTLQIAPTIINDVSWDHEIMKEEIFGPLLPVIEFTDLNEMIEIIKQRPKPLSCYMFTNSKQNEQQVLSQVSFGGGCINDTIVHLATPYMPFGGVGDSGMGGYHGKYSFDTFSHLKSVLKKANWLDLPLRYPPYKESTLKLLKKIMK